MNDVVDIILAGYGDTDADGILSVIEDAAPNAGDNNFDEILDSEQNKVTSFVSNIGGYITLVVDDNNVVSNVSMVSVDQLPDLPSDVEFKYGEIGFQIDVDQPGARIEVGLILPVAATELTAYYFFGATEDNPVPHWYPYEAVRVITNSSLNESQAVRDFIRLEVQDGGLGDADQTVNGRISLPHGAPAYSMKASGGKWRRVGSALNVLFLGFFTVIMLLMKRKILSVMLS